MPTLLAYWLRNLPIRYKLLVTYSAVFILFLTLGGAVTYFLVRQTLEQNIESELKNSTTAILNLVKTSVTGSIRNYLRAVADRNLEIVEHLYERYRRGELSEEEAKSRAEDVILSQKIGDTGYVCCLDSEGVVLVHPKRELLFQNLSEYEFVQELTDRKKGYLEYDWKNPGELAPRPKAMYMAYFEPWDWILIASSYREEFARLVNVDDFRESVLSLKFGESGYTYVADADGKTIIHPKVEGSSIFAQQDVPSDFFDIMRTQKSGKIQYSWKNPGEDMPRQKLVIFDHIPEYDWIVASTSYLDEVYAPLHKVRNLFVFTILGSLLLVLPLTFRISSSITSPIKQLAEGFSQGATGDLSLRMPSRSKDEVGRLATYFNTFMERLEEYSANLRAEISERKQAEEALRESEERYRSVMEAAPDPVVVYDMEGRVLYFNPAFARVFGWSLEECQGKKMDHFVPEDCWPETRQGIERILAGQTLSGVRTRRCTREGDQRHVSISGATFRDRDGRLAGSVMILRDTTERVRAERALAMSEEMFSKAFRSSPNGISIITLKDRNFLNVNDSFLLLTGYAREEVLGRTTGELHLFSPPEVGPALLREIQANGQLRAREVEFRTKAGEQRLGRISAELLEIWDEPCMLTTIEDVTEWRRLEREVIESGDRERMRIGQELHDDLQPHLIGVEVVSKILEEELEGASRPEREYAEKIRTLIDEAIQKTRALARGLCPVYLPDDGLEFALRELVANTQDIYGIECAFHGEGQGLIEENSVATQLFYIAREAVHNAVKHAAAERITVDLSRREDGVVLRVEDDGRGFVDTPSGKGMGLRIMGFRAGMIGATLSLETGPGEGTAVSVVAPGSHAQREI